MGLKRLLEERGMMPTDYDDWRKIEETETAAPVPGLLARNSSGSMIGWRRSGADCRLRFRQTRIYLAAALAPAATLVALKRVPVGE